MSFKTEELLNFLLWSVDMFARPTFRNLTGSYESWVYRNGLQRRVHSLREQRALEADSSARNERRYCLTKGGRIRALGGRDPEAEWARAWDGRWRIVIFDVPIRENTRRAWLRRHLRARSFGCLQRSVWISPDPTDALRATLMDGNAASESLFFIETAPAPGDHDPDIVTAAWNFSRINAHYAADLALLKQRPRAPLRTRHSARALERWAAEERRAWITAVRSDPLLPKPLLPHDYLGCRVWERRVQVLRQAGRQLRTFRL